MRRRVTRFEGAARRRLLTPALAVAAAALITVLAIFARPVETAETEASAVAREFFDAMSSRHWEEVCGLLSHDFHVRNNLTNDQVCFMALHLGFTLRENIVFEMGEVERRGGDVLVHAVADGAPGVIRLITEDGSYRIDSLAGQ